MLKSNLEKVFSQIEKGNNLGEKIHLVLATKTVSPDIINEAIGYGAKIVAENRVQEFREKNSLVKGAEQQFIGHLQTNKVKYLVGKVSLIQSVDSVHLAEAIDAQAKKIGVVQDVLIEINVGGELSKSGFCLENAVQSTLEIANAFKNVNVVGLMAMLPKSQDEEFLSSLMQKMRDVYDLLKVKLPFKYLSMGMSNDYALAIKNGSNMIRLGRTVFGERV